jgi:hypothetical protein
VDGLLDGIAARIGEPRSFVDEVWEGWSSTRATPLVPRPSVPWAPDWLYDDEAAELARVLAKPYAQLNADDCEYLLQHVEPGEIPTVWTVYLSAAFAEHARHLARDDDAIARLARPARARRSRSSSPSSVH